MRYTVRPSPTLPDLPHGYFWDIAKPMSPMNGRFLVLRKDTRLFGVPVGSRRISEEIVFRDDYGSVARKLMTRQGLHFFRLPVKEIFHV